MWLADEVFLRCDLEKLDKKRFQKNFLKPFTYHYGFLERDDSNRPTVTVHNIVTFFQHDLLIMRPL